jgi:phenylpyruvate tautomerase PptA (4-oxalocrotonate tautomerase family)
MSKRKSPAEKDALAKEVTRLSNRWLEANRGNPEFQPEHYATKKNPFGDKEKANVAFGKALKKIETDLCKERGLVYSKYQDGEYMLEAPKSLIELYGKGVGGHRGVAHPKTKEETAEYFQQWYKKNRKSVLKRMAKQRLEGGANGDEGETDSEMDTDTEDEDEVNPLALPHFWNGQEWVPVVPNPPPANLMEDDEIIEGNGYYRMSDGCSLYTGGSLQPVNYNSELKSNSWLGYGYGSRGHVMPVNHSAELKSSFGTF